MLDDLKRLAEDEDPRVRAAAVRSIGVRFGRSEDPELRTSALERLTGAFGDDVLVALAALEALREIGGPEAGAAVALLERSEPEVVREAIGCIASHDVAAMDVLLPLVSHSDWSVRAEAIQALSDRRVARAVPSILRRLETEQDEFVRDVILRALKQLEG